MRDKIICAVVEGNLLQKTYDKAKKIFFNCFNGVYRKRLFKKIDSFIANIAIKSMMKKIEIQKNKILFITTRGSYNCNPKAIADEMIRQKIPCKLVWVARQENLYDCEQYPKDLKIVSRGSYEFYKEAASSKIWIENAMSLAYLNVYKKAEQILIQTWHGSIGLKSFDTNKDKVWIKKARGSGEITDFCISNSSFEDDLYKKTFWKNTTILTYGHPRNDILLNGNKVKIDKIQKKVRTALNIPSGVKIALYAPTFRDSKSLAPYQLNYGGLRDVLAQRFGGNWIILCRLHFQVRAVIKKKRINYPEFVIDATDYEDIQDILLLTDVGITDYSSWICDYMLTRRPGFLFATDLRTYYDERGFCVPLESTPFPLAQNNEELFSNIMSFNEKKYQQDCERFLTEKGCVEDGHAAERVVEKIKQILGDETA